MKHRKDRLRIVIELLAWMALYWCALTLADDPRTTRMRTWRAVGMTSRKVAETAGRLAIHAEVRYDKERP